MADYYEMLGVSRDATQDEIKKRFRQLARSTHPDANPNDANAEERFREIAQAYEVLSDPQRRAAYDRGERFSAGDLFSNFAGLDEILQQFFGAGFGGFGFGTRTRTGPQRGSDVRVTLDLTLAEAAAGVSREVHFRAPGRCPVCAGLGAAPGSEPIRCTACGGRGQVQVSRATILGSMMTVTDCPTCGGRGEIIEEPCPECRGGGRVEAERSLTVEIPGGVDDGTRLRLSGRGAAGDRSAPPGDLYVQVQVQPDDRFERSGDDLRHRIVLGMTEAALGTKRTVPLVDGDETEIDIPQGTQSGTVFRLARQGMPRLRRRGHGDLLIEVEVRTPEDLSDEQKDLLRSLAELRGEHPVEYRRRRRRRSS